MRENAQFAYFPPAQASKLSGPDRWIMQDYIRCAWIWPISLGGRFANYLAHRIYPGTRLEIKTSIRAHG